MSNGTDLLAISNFCRYFPSTSHMAARANIPVLVKNLDNGKEITIIVTAKRYKSLYENLTFFNLSHF